MARLYNTFEFVGNVSIPKPERFLDVQESRSGWMGHRLNFAVQESKTNSVYVEMYGGYSKAKSYPVLTFGKGTENVKGAKLEIPWSDRLNEESVNMVADFKKFVIDFTTDHELKEEINKIRFEIRSIEYKDEPTSEDNEKLAALKKELKEKGKDRYEFIHEYDAVLFLSENLEAYKAHKFKVTGNVDYNYHNGNFYRKFKPTTIEIVKNEEPSRLRATMDLFFTKDAIDDKDFDKDKKIHLNTYVLSYDSNAKKDAFFPQQVVINAQKIDMNNEAHVKRLEFLKNKFAVKGKGVYHLPWLVNVFRGADRVEFTEKDLTPTQRESIEFGLSKLEDYIPKGGFTGETTEENRLIKPLLQLFDTANDFRDGVLEAPYEAEDLDYVPVAKEDKKVKEEEVKSEDIAADIELDDLFS